jgi:hypothetical protein
MGWSKSPTSRTLNRLRRLGYVAGVVERFIHGAGERGQGIRVDFLHCIDIIAAKRGEPILAVQATTLGNVGTGGLRAVPGSRCGAGRAGRRDGPSRSSR